MAKKEKKKLEEPSAPFWMTTYGDMVTLLMVFFILILSFSVIQLEKFKGAMSSMKGALGVMPEMSSTYKRIDPNLQDEESRIRQEMVSRISSIEEVLRAMSLSEFVELEANPEGVLIRMGDKLLFESGKAEIMPRALPVLDQIIQTFDGTYKAIYVEGHTDNVPISSARYPSNWELSAARALNVVRYLSKKGHIHPSKLAAVGHGEHRPLLPNTTPQNRAKNRRVEILLRMDE